MHSKFKITTRDRIKDVGGLVSMKPMIEMLKKDNITLN